GVLRQVNHAAVSALGASARKLVGSPLSDLLSDDAKETFERHLGQVAKAPSRVAIELALSAGGSEGRTIQMMSVPMADDASQVMAVLVDVTERKRSERMLHALSQASALFSSAVAPSAVVDGLSKLAVPLLADVCVCELYQPSGEAHVASAATPKYEA